MRTYLDCIPCFMDQALRTARMATDDEILIKEVLDSTGELIRTIPLQNTPPETSNIIYQNIRKITRNDDPYQKIKETNIKQVLTIYPKLKAKVDKSEDPLLMAIRMAIAGNVIDFGVSKKFKLEESIEEITTQEFAIFDYESFKKSLRNASSILYLGDNAGESVFDRLLIEKLGKPVKYVVRESPVINDCIYEDAVASGLGEVTEEIISSGSTAPATIPELCNQSFLEAFQNADMIISKGQGNYEGLSKVSRPVFFLLKAKCHVIACDLKILENDIVLKGININNQPND